MGAAHRGQLTRGNRELLDRFLLGGARSQSEVIAAEQEFFDKVWYGRNRGFKEAWESGEERWRGEDIYQGAVKAAEEVRDRWGEENLGPFSDFEWGMISGKLSALRWVLGSEWDFLDT